MEIEEIPGGKKEIGFDDLPDHFLSAVMKYIPNKKNLFLVNKRFEKEAINVTRNRCILNINHKTVSYTISAAANIKNFPLQNYFRPFTA